MTATRAMSLLETYTIRLFVPDRELTPQQEDWLAEDRERFDAALRKLVDETGHNSALSIAISSC